MKAYFLHVASVLTVVFVLAGCTTTSSVRPYSPSTPGEIQKGFVYSLPKTILQTTITYSLCEKRIWPSDEQGNPRKTDQNGKLASPKSSAKVVVIDKPIQVTTITIADPSMRFIFDVDSLSGFSKSTDITLELTNNGLLKSSNTVIQDKTKEIVSNTTATLINVAKIAAVAGADVVEMVPIKDFVVSRVIDPADIKFEAASTKYCATYSDKSKGATIFERSIAVPEVAIKLCGEGDISKNIHIKSDSFVSSNNEPEVINGLPYRVGSPMRVTISVDAIEVYDQFHMFAQAGTIAIIPLSAKAFSDVTQGISFSDDGTLLTKYTSKGTSVGEAVSSAGKETTGSMISGISEVRQIKLDRLKKEKEILEAQKAIDGQKALAETQAKIEKLKKEKELIDAEIDLEESKKKLSESQPK